MQNRKEKSIEFKINPRRTWDLKELGCTKVAAALDNQRITFYEGTTTLRIYDLDAKIVFAERVSKYDNEYANNTFYKISGYPIQFTYSNDYEVTNQILDPTTLATTYTIPY